MKMSAYWNVQVRWSFKIQRAFGVCLLDFIIFSCFHHFYFYSCALVLQAEHPIRVISLSNCPKLIQLAQPAKKPPTVWNAAYRCSMMDRLDGRPLDWCITVLKLAKIKIKNNNLSRKIKNMMISGPHMDISWNLVACITSRFCPFLIFHCPLSCLYYH